MGSLCSWQKVRSSGIVQGSWSDFFCFQISEFFSCSLASWSPTCFGFQQIFLEIQWIPVAEMATTNPGRAGNSPALQWIRELGFRDQCEDFTNLDPSWSIGQLSLFRGGSLSFHLVSLKIWQTPSDLWISLDQPFTRVAGRPEICLLGTSPNRSVRTVLERWTDEPIPPSCNPHWGCMPWWCGGFGKISRYATRNSNRFSHHFHHFSNFI